MTAFDERKIEMPRKRQGRASLAKTSPAIFIRSNYYIMNHVICNIITRTTKKGRGTGTDTVGNRECTKKRFVPPLPEEYHHTNYVHNE